MLGLLKCNSAIIREPLMPNLQLLQAIAAFEGLSLAAATVVTEKFVELRPGFPTMPLRARVVAKPEVQISQKVRHELHGFSYLVACLDF